jgi:hypothetical protein
LHLDPTVVVQLDPPPPTGSLDREHHGLVLGTAQLEGHLGLLQPRHHLRQRRERRPRADDLDHDVTGGDDGGEEDDDGDDDDDDDDDGGGGGGGVIVGGGSGSPGVTPGIDSVMSIVTPTGITPFAPVAGTS